MTIEEFQDELEKHDWFYDYSDDNRVWTLGKQNFLRLVQIASDLGREYKALFNNYYYAHFPKAISPIKQD